MSYFKILKEETRKRKTQMSSRVQVEGKALEALIAALKGSDKEFQSAARKLIYTVHTRGAGLWAIQNSESPDDDDDFDGDDDDAFAALGMMERQ